MNPMKPSFAVTVLLVALFATSSQAQLASDVAEKLRTIGAVISPPATSAIFAPRVVEREPYANVKVTRDRAYGPAERHLLDTFLPEAAGPARPVLIYVHGGAFTLGNRRIGSGPFYDNVMLWAVRNGMVGVNMTYRLAPQFQWPAGAEDVGRALQWVQQNFATLGGDPARIYLLGHSAGAENVAEYLAHPRLQAAGGPGVAGAMLLSAVYQVRPPLVISVYHGDDPARHAEQSALRGLATSPVPLFVGAAELDPPPFAAQSVEAIEALCRLSRCPASAVFAGHNHMSQVFSIHTDDRSVSDALLAFMRSTPPR